MPSMSEGPPLAVPGAELRRLAFLGTPDAAVPSLRALVQAGYEVGLVVTQPDRRRGRGSKLIPSPVKAAAEELDLPVEYDLAALTGADIDLAVVVAYGQLIPRRLLERTAMVNVHFSLLPRWRGAAPVERALLAGDAVTGVCIMAVAGGLDTGDVYATEELVIGPDITAAELTAELADRGARLLVATLDSGLVDDDGVPLAEPQRGEATYAAKLQRSENEVNFGLAAVDVDRRVRIGRAWTMFRGTRLGIDQVRPIPEQVAADQPGTITEVAGEVVLVATADGCVQLVQVKPEGRRSQAVGDWVNGAQPEVGEMLGIPEPSAGSESELSSEVGRS